MSSEIRSLKLFHFLSDTASKFRLWEWRDSVHFRNELIRAASLKIIDEALDEVEEIIAELRQLVLYKSLNHKDRAIFRGYAKYLRRIVKFWHLLADADKRAYREGATVPSAVFRKINQLRRKSTRKATAAPVA
jgi:hypothetical protein